MNERMNEWMKEETSFSRNPKSERTWLLKNNIVQKFENLVCFMGFEVRFDCPPPTPRQKNDESNVWTPKLPPIFFWGGKTLLHETFYLTNGGKSANFNFWFPKSGGEINRGELSYQRAKFVSFHCIATNYYHNRLKIYPSAGNAWT